MQSFSDILKTLYNNYHHSWWRFLFKPSTLGRLFSQNTAKPFDFFKSYFSSWWWNRLWFKSLIKDETQKARFNRICDFTRQLNQQNTSDFNETKINQIIFV